MPRFNATTDLAEHQWTLFAPRLAGQPVFRWMNAAGNYLRSSERDLTCGLPARPAAVRIYDEAGTCSALFLDFDSGKVPAARLQADLTRIRVALLVAGVGFFEDASISGGHHIYVPLAERMSCAVARAWVERVAASLESLDPSPHRSVESGCIRVPGSRHRAGGFQQLITPMEQALRVFDAPAGLHSLDAILETFPVQGGHTATETTEAASAGRRAVRADLMALMLDGTLPARYPSPSEGRMAAVCSLVSSGWSTQDIYTEMTSGTFQGLGALYSRYSPTQAQSTFQREYAKAVQFTTTTKVSIHSKEKHGAICDMNQASTSQGGASTRWDEHGFLRKHRATLDIYDQRLRVSLPPRQVPGAQMLLRAFLAFGHMTDSRDLAIGTRNLGLATGMSYQSVARLLQQIRAIPGSPIQRLYTGSGLEADTYRIVLDPDLEPLAERRGLPRGKVHALRPVFRALGAHAALVYEGLERLDNPTINDLAAYTGLHRGTVRDALHTLLIYRMVARTEAGTWRVDHTANLAQLARDLGALDDFERQLHLYREHRKHWREIVTAHVNAYTVGPRHLDETDLYDEERETYWVPPPDADHTGVELVSLAA
ncbi:MAG: hypothetical protein ACTII7_09790 [Galactobacter sp.]